MIAPIASLLLLAGLVTASPVERAIGKRAPSDPTSQTTPCDYVKYLKQAQDANVLATVGYEAVGCYADSHENFGRVLADVRIETVLTAKQCADACIVRRGYTYAGVEYGHQCFCGNTLASGFRGDNAPGFAGGGFSGEIVPYSECQANKCQNDAGSDCGGYWRLNVFKKANTTTAFPKTYANLDCTSTTSSAAPAASSTSAADTLPYAWSAATTPCIQEVANRALDATVVSWPNMTINTCLARCDSLGFSFAGLEYSSECHCGNYLAHGASMSVASNGCTMKCSGDSTKTCGGSNALQIYYKDQTKSVAGYSSTTQIDGYTVPACVQEVSGRALTGASTASPSMTIDTCVAFCSGKGFSMAGIEYGSECYCGNSLSNGAKLSPVSYECKMPCPGNSGQVCGGPNAISLWTAVAA